MEEYSLSQCSACLNTLCNQICCLPGEVCIDGECSDPTSTTTTTTTYAPTTTTTTTYAPPTTTTTTTTTTYAPPPPTTTPDPCVSCDVAFEGCCGGVCTPLVPGWSGLGYNDADECYAAANGNPDLETLCDAPRCPQQPPLPPTTTMQPQPTCSGNCSIECVDNIWVNIGMEGCSEGCSCAPPESSSCPQNGNFGTTYCWSGEPWV